MGTYVPTIDVFTSGGTLAIGTSNASTINIGNQNSTINVNSSLNLTGTLNFSNINLQSYLYSEPDTCLSSKQVIVWILERVFIIICSISFP